MIFRKSTRLNGSRIAIVLRSNANVTPDAVPGAPFVQFEKPQQTVAVFLFVWNGKIKASVFNKLEYLEEVWRHGLCPADFDRFAVLGLCLRSGSEDYNGYFSGASAATPFMAGSNPVQNPDYDIDGTLDFEAGIPNYSNFSWNDAYRWSFWEGENDAVFDANREISFTEYTIQKGKRYYNFSTTEKVVLGYAFVSKD